MALRPRLLLAAVAIASLAAGVPALKAAAPATRAVATESGLATREAMRVLEQGGNAVDAAVTAALVAGVASPTSSGLGGGGFALVWMAGAKKATLLDFRETAPQGVDAEAFERRPLPPAERGKLVGVPGEVAGLYELHRRFGKKPWAELVGHAERQARAGFLVEAHLASVLSQKGSEAFQRDPGLKGLFYPGSKAVKLGARLRRPNLAKTLARIAQEGPAALYGGSIAAELVRVAREHGGALSEEDLKSYQVAERAPLTVSWEGYEVQTMPAPSSGGLLLAQVLALNTRAELQRLGLRSPAYVHVLSEAIRGALADRYRYVGDPAFVPVDFAKLLAPARMAERKALIALERTHSAPTFAKLGQGTHHLSLVDSEGNAVALTTTVNTAFGADLLAPASGIILNDELDDFAADKDAKSYGPVNPNKARAGARPVSSMTPTLVLKDGRVVLVAGGSGGQAIMPSVTQALLAKLVFDEPIDKAVAAPRFYPGTGVPTLRLDEGGWSERDLAELGWRGEQATAISFKTAVQLVAVGPEGATAAADPRKVGVGMAR